MLQILDSDDDEDSQVKLSPAQQTSQAKSSLTHQPSLFNVNSSLHPTHLIDSHDSFNFDIDYDP